MTKRVAVPYKDVKLKIVGTAGDFMAHRIQRFDIPANIPNTTINEIGNPKHAGIVTDVPEVTATFQAFDVSPKIFAYLTGTDPTSYPATGVDVSKLGYVDLIGYVKEANVAENLKCIYAGYMKITDFNFSYSVDGEATEDYTCAGSKKKYLKNDAFVDKGALTAGTMTLTHAPKELKNGDKLLSLIVEGEWLNEGTDYTVSGTVVTVSGATNEYALAVYHTQSGVMTWTDISDSTVPAAIRGKNIPIYIDAERQYRVQSVSIRGTFPNTKISEMGTVEVVGYVTDPCDVTGEITVMDTDNELVALLATGSKDGDAYGEYDVNEYEERHLSLDIKVLDPANTATVLKTIYIPEMRITSEGTSVNVGNQLAQTFSFSSNTSECFVYSGARA